MEFMELFINEGKQVTRPRRNIIYKFQNINIRQFKKRIYVL